MTIILPLADQPVTTTPTGLRITTLREDPNSGAQTLILEAPPRPPGPSRPHFHMATEEIFNLGPTMTFDPGRPLPRYGYARYPAQMPHGTAVSLPEGYRLFVRYNGSAEVHFKDDAAFAPTPDHLYLPNPPTSGPDLGWGIITYALSEAAFLARLSPGAVLTLPPRSIELFLIRGTLAASNGPALVRETYLYSENEVPSLTAQDDAMALLYFV